MNKKLSYIVIFGIIYLLTYIGFFFFVGLKEPASKEQINSPYLMINELRIPVEVVDTPEKRTLGLSYRESLASDSGMLFVMPSRRVSSFWMKEMRFPLDIIWIDGDKIVNLSQDLPPGGPQPKNSYSSLYPVDQVLEVNGGFAEKNGIKIGDQVIFEIK